MLADSLCQCKHVTLYNVKLTDVELGKNTLSSVERVITNFSSPTFYAPFLANTQHELEILPTSYTIDSMQRITPDYCRDLTFQEDSFGGVNALNFSMLTELESLHLASGCCPNLTSFKLKGLSRLHTLVIHSNCASGLMNSGVGEFCLSELDALKTLTMEDHCFVHYASFAIQCWFLISG